jgi:hypothetical protein
VWAHRKLRDRPPALKVRIHAHEQISGEERSQHPLRAPGVPYARAHQEIEQLKELESDQAQEPAAAPELLPVEPLGDVREKKRTNSIGTYCCRRVLRSHTRSLSSGRDLCRDAVDLDAPCWLTG